jgi:hypothetical protein
MNPSVPNSQIREYVKRPKLYENIDGTGELFFGIMCLGFWVGSYLEALMPAESFWGKGHPGHFVMMIWFGVVLGAGYWVTRTIKRRITFPRTGYVAQRVGGPGTRVLMGLRTAGISAAICLTFWMLVRGHHIGAGRIAVLVCLIGPYAAVAILANGSHKWKWALAAGLALAVTGSASIRPGSAFLHQANLIVGLVWLASGGITLLLYIRRTKAPEAEGE